MKYEFHEAAAAFPMHNKEQYADLLESLRTHGWDKSHPVVLCEGKVLDGRNRYKACDELGLEPTFVEYVGDPYAKAWLENGSRRDLAPDQRGACKMRCNSGSEAWRAAQRQRHEEANRKRSEAAGQQGRAERGKFTGHVSRDTRPVAKPHNWARTDLAKQAGISEATAGRLQSLASKRPDLVDKIADGELKLSDAIRQTRREEVTQKLESTTAMAAKEASGVYDVLVVDPPWPMQKIDRDERPNQVAFDYPTMSEQELEVLSLPCADDCHVWVWTTHKFLPTAMRLLGKWGLSYVCTFVWHKPGGFQPIGLPQYNCEFALYARRGKVEFVDTKAFPTCFNAPRTAHSEKPEEFYEMVRRVTAGRRLDMFNRRRIDGFDGWGKEAAA